MSLTDEVKLAPYAFVTPLGVDKLLNLSKVNQP